MSAVAIALNRFGLGARPDSPAIEDPKRWLTDQFERYEAHPAVLADAPTTAVAAASLAEYQQARQAARRETGGPAPKTGTSPAPAMAGAAPMRETVVPPAMESEAQAAVRFARGQGRDHYAASAGSRMNAALVSPTPFVDRLVHFWANHFAVSADKLQVIGLAGPFEFEAIRPYVLGRFGDMLAAVERHPAMLLYLDQAQSIGPNSPLGSRTGRFNPQRKVGLNENLAREIMELHTLGVRTGYGQDDVTELARALTGWTVAGLGRGPGARLAGIQGKPGDFIFAERLHEPGDRTILGKRYAQGGERQATAVLADLAVHPATARHIALKLVRHFVADDPPAAAVGRVEAAFLRSGGDLPSVYRALIDAPEAWAPLAVKFKTPWEWSVSTLRALGIDKLGVAQTVGLLQQLGQPTWRPGSPAGWDDIAASWAGPDAIMRRVEAAERFATRAGIQVDARARAAAVMPGAVSPATQQALGRAESAGQAIALMLVAPEFMRR